MPSPLDDCPGPGCIGPALADVFSIDEPEVVRGEQELELNAAVRDGFPINAEPIQHSWELIYTNGVTNWLSIAPKIDFDKPLDDEFHATVIAAETVWFPVTIGQSVKLAWFTELEIAVNRDETNAVTYGPIIQFGGDKLSLILNPYFENTFGQNREAGTEFEYQWQAKAGVNERLALGIEGYGVIPNIGNAPGIDFQEHRIGPVIYYETEMPGANKIGLELDAGILFGLTDATPDVTGKVNAGLVF